MAKHTRSLAALLLGGLLATAGCAAGSARQDVDRMNGPGKELLKAWQQASRQSLDQADAVPDPEPKLLPSTHFAAGTVFEKQRNYGQAVEQYRRAIELNRDYGAAYARLGLCYLHVGQADQAVDSLRRAADLLPGNAQVQNNLGFAYLAKGDNARAETCFARALAIQPTFERARMNLALALVRQQRDADALDRLRAAAPEHLALYNLGAMQLAQGRAASARESFEKALDLRPEFPAARKALDQALARLPQTPAEPAVAQVAAPAVPAAEPAATVAAELPVATVAAEPAPLASANEAAGPVDAPAAPGGPAVTSRPVAGADGEVMIAATELPEATKPADRPGHAPGAEANSWARLEILPDSWLDDAALLVWGPAIRLERPEDARYEAVADAITASMFPAPVSVVDLDLASLQWAVWMRAVEAVHTDLEALSTEQLPAVLGKWLSALNELEGLVADPLPVYASAR